MRNHTNSSNDLITIAITVGILAISAGIIDCPDPI
jgi:hypothetical protein